MPSRSKPIALIKQEGNRRGLSKREIEHRENEEKKLNSNIKIKEWESVKRNINAHKEFLRLKKILKNIDKDDGLFESSINRYCLLYSECFELTEISEKLDKNKKNDLEKYFIIDKKLMEKQRIMIQIEKENIMTISSALRSIPKKPNEDKQDDPMEKLLRGG